MRKFAEVLQHAFMYLNFYSGKKKFFVVDISF